MFLKELIIGITIDPYSYAEEITAIGGTFALTIIGNAVILHPSFNWKIELMKWILGLVASIFNAYVVNRLKKKWWDKPKKPKK